MLANSSRAAGSAPRRPPTVAYTNAGVVTSAARNRVAGVPGPVARRIDVMYATHGVTMISTSNGWAACSSGRIAVITAPNTSEITSEIATAITRCLAVTQVSDR